jgi:hypothetical protein
MTEKKIYVPKLVIAYPAEIPDLSVPEQKVLLDSSAYSFKRSISERK